MNKPERIKISKTVTIGDQIGTLEYDETNDVRIALTNVKGTIKLCDLESVLKEARDLHKRVFPEPATPAKKRRR